MSDVSEMEQDNKPADLPAGVEMPLSADELWEGAASLPGETAAAPPEAPLEMVAQDFRARPPQGPDAGLPRPGTIAARLVAMVTGYE